MIGRIIYLWWTTALCLLIGPSSLLAVSLGATKAQVIEELGKPLSQASGGGREILSYPKGVRLTLIEGRVESAKGILLTGEETEAPATKTAPKIAAPAPVAEESTETADTEPSTTATPQLKSPAPKNPTNQSPGAQSIPAKPPHTFDPAAYAEQEREPPKSTPALPVVGVVLLLGFHFIATLLALKLAFKFWNMDALFTGLLAIGGIDLGVHVVLELLGPVTYNLSKMPAVENGLAGFVLIFTIRHFCFNKNIADAIQTAAVVKIAVMLLKLFGAMALLNSAFL